MVHVYSGKLPNYRQNAHAFFTDFTKYNAWLGEPLLSFSEDRYTINGNIAEISIPPSGDWQDITYLAWDNGGAWRYYFVRSAVWQSGYAILSLELDEWATFLPFAKISNIRVNRCNRKIGRGVYDDIPVTYSASPVRLDDSTLTEDQLSIVFVVAMATGVSTILANNAATALAMYALNVGSIPVPDPVPEGFRKLFYAIDYVSGIISTVADVGDLEGSLQANVLKAYIVPSAMLINRGTQVPQFNYNGRYSKGKFMPNFEVSQGQTRKYISIEIDPNYKYFVGTRYSGLEIVRETGTTGVYYEYITGQDALQVNVRQGDKMLDITSAFEIGLTSNDGNFTTAQKIAGILQAVGGIASGGFQIATGGAGYVTGALTVANAISGAVRQGNARYSPGGDGLSTFLINLAIEAPPYYANTYQSISNEKAHARLYGATFNKQIAAISDVFAFDLIGEGDLTDTLIAADCRVDGIPAEARDLIAGSLADGVYITKI